MKKKAAYLLLAGLSLLIALIAWQGVNVLDELDNAGWKLLWLVPVFLPIMALGTTALRTLFAPHARPSFAAVYHANWIGLAVNWFLPVAQIGGEFVKARVLGGGAMRYDRAMGGIVVDKTIQALTQAVYALIGLAFFAYAATGDDVIVGALAFLVFLSLGIYGFYRVQQAGMFVFLARIADKLIGGRFNVGLSGGASKIDVAIREIYKDRNRFLRSCLWRMAFRLSLAGEIWLALYLFGHPVGFMEAVILESLTNVVVSIAFAIPGALGVQEGGFMLLSAALGLGAEVGLAVSLARRSRDILIGIPALIAWQIDEGRRAGKE